MSNKGHIHAELMAQYAEDAKEHEEPWKLWQVKYSGGIWKDCRTTPNWHFAKEFRHKPKTHIVNGVEIPDLRFTPEIDQHYCYPDPSGEEIAWRSVHKKWSSSDRHRVENNLCYELTDEGKRAAILHAKAMLGTAE